ncbi:MAG: uridine kinase [Omnitrophica WOR_2 bacterium]|jgi:uridine kinase
MLNEVLLLNKAHEKAAGIILDRVLPEYKRKYIIAISGEVETGKSEVAHMVGRLLKKENIKVKMIYLDSYYKVLPLERTAWRKEHGIESIGAEEYDWKKINDTVDAFLKDKKASMPCVDLFTGQIDQLTTDFKEIDMLIIAGLYSMMVEKANLKVFIENDYKDTLSNQIETGQEELDEYRMKVLEQEHKVVQSLKHKADFFLDFDTNIENLHL